MMDVNRSVVQSNHFLENKPKMSVDESRVFLTIVSIFDERKPDFELYQLPVSGFAELWGLGLDSAYDQFKTAVKGLAEKKFFIEGTDENKKRDFFTGSFISNARYKEGEAYAAIRIDPELKPFFLELKRTYTKYILENVLYLNQKHSIRLYELLKQYETIGKRSFSPEQLKKMLYIEGKYKDNNYNFRKIALDPAVKEICEKTDLNVQLMIKGRGPDAVFEFRIQGKEKAIPIAPPMDVGERKNDLIEEARRIIVANDIPSSGEEYLAWLESKIQHLQIENRYAYLQKCIVNIDNITNYREEVQIQKERSAKRAENEELVGQIELRLAKEQGEKLEEYLRDVPEFILAMPEGAKKVQMINAWKSSPKLKDEDENEDVIPAWVEELGPLPKVRDTFEDFKLSPKKPFVRDPEIIIENFRDDDDED